MAKNILCIDDIEANLFTIKSVLEAAGNDSYNIFTAISAHDGFDILFKNKIDLILLDIMMPEVDGFMAAKMIRSNKRTKKIPIIFATAKKDDITIEKCYKVGGVDYINKPFNPSELLNRVAFHLSLKDKEKMLQKEKEYAQKVFDLQENLIFVTDSNQVINANKSALDYFGAKDLYEFQKEHGCLAEVFVKEEEYYYLKDAQKQLDWIEEVIDLLKNGDVVVKLLSSTGLQHVFTLKVALIYDYYLIVLTDITSISNLSKEYEHKANFDELTQIFNRNMFNALIYNKMAEVKFNKTKLSFAILDIDHFKQVNDAYGHLVGDAVLKSLVQVIKKHIRSEDIFARWGGEEFVLAFNVNIQRAVEIAESLRKHIEKEPLDIAGNITCSFGVTEFKAQDTLESMTQRADRGLYEAKNSGRNRVCKV